MTDDSVDIVRFDAPVSTTPDQRTTEQRAAVDWHISAILALGGAVDLSAFDSGLCMACAQPITSAFYGGCCQVGCLLVPFYLCRSCGDAGARSGPALENLRRSIGLKFIPAQGSA